MFYENALKKVEEHFQGTPGIVFVAISVDRTQALWKRGINSGMYTGSTSSNVFNLYTSGKNLEHPIVKHYDIMAYPCPILIDKEGKIIEFDNRMEDKPDKWISKINEALNNKE
jgi:hypothetical protein